MKKSSKEAIVSSEQDLIRIPDEMRERLAKRLKENGMVLFTRIEVLKYGVAFYWDGIASEKSVKDLGSACDPDKKPECPFPLKAECDEQTGTWSCEFPH